MDPIRFYHVLHSGLGIAALLIALATLTVVWRLRGVLQWKRSLKHEFRELKDELYAAGPCRQQAIQVVLDRCQGIWQAGFPEINDDFRTCRISAGYRRRISSGSGKAGALCHRRKPDPRFSHAQSSGFRTFCTGRDFHGFKKCASGIFEKPGTGMTESAGIGWFKAYIRYRRWINHANMLRLILLPDPFSWLIYLSNQLTILSLTRFFLMDIYLFAGKTGDSGL